MRGQRSRRILLTFFWGTRNFFRGKGLHTQANTRPAARPPSGQSDIPRKGNLGGGTTWPASPIFFQTLIPNCQSIPITAIKTLAVTRTSPIEVGSTYLLVPMRTTECNAGGAKKRRRGGGKEKKKKGVVGVWIEKTHIIFIFLIS